MAKGFRAHKCNASKEIFSGVFSTKIFFFGFKTSSHRFIQVNSPLSMNKRCAEKQDLTAIKIDLLNLNQSELFADRKYYKLELNFQ